MLTRPAPFTARCWRCDHEVHDRGTVWDRQIYQNGDVPCPRCGAHDGFHVPEDYSAALDLCDPDPPPVPTIELSKIMVSGEDSLRGPTVRQGPRQRVSLDQARRMLAQGEYDIYVNGRHVAYWSEAGRVFRA